MSATKPRSNHFFLGGGKAFEISRNIEPMVNPIILAQVLKRCKRNKNGLDFPIKLLMKDIAFFLEGVDFMEVIR